MAKKSAKNTTKSAAKAGAVSISESEWLVMELLWARSPRGSQEIAGELAESKGWARTTTLTLLRRLVGKGAVRVESGGARSLYAPAVGRPACVTAEATSLLDRLFGGALHPFVAHFAKQKRLTREDVSQLRALLDQIDSSEK